MQSTSIGNMHEIRVHNCIKYHNKGAKTMLKYKIDILAELKKQGITTYKIRQRKIFGESVVQQMRDGELVSYSCINTLCKLLQCQVGDILEYVPDEPNEPNEPNENG